MKLLYTLLLLDLYTEVHKGQNCLLVDYQSHRKQIYYWKTLNMKETLGPDTNVNFRYFHDSYKYHTWDYGFKMILWILHRINEKNYSNFIFTLTDVLQNCNSKICTKPCLDTWNENTRPTRITIYTKQKYGFCCR